jgi:NIMA (never in mitosis gene a)-related kinase
VIKIKSKSNGGLYAWKEVFYGRMSEKEKTLLVNEVNILREFIHQNIVRYYDRILDKRNCKIYIIMEYCEGGDLGSLIKKCKETGYDEFSSC